MSEQLPYLHRDLSWLSFNHRVLQEAMDPTVPLLERVKFMAIYASNLDEFFRVRVAGHRNLLRLGKSTKKELNVDPKVVLRAILKEVNAQQELFSKIFSDDLIPNLANHGVYLRRRLDLTRKQQIFVEEYFHDHMLPFVQPVLLIKNKVRPFLINGALYLVIEMVDRVTVETTYALVKIPSGELGRFIVLPSTQEDKKEIILMDDIVRHSISWMFPGYDIKDTYSIKLTRDAELYIDDEFSGDLVDKIRKGLAKRHVGPASRFVYDREMPLELLDYLKDTFNLGKYDLLREGRYQNNSDWFSFPDFGMVALKNPPMPPIPETVLSKTEDFWQAIREEDHLLYYPYHDYEAVVRFFEEASADPTVTHIKIVQYRVAKKSRIMDAIREAVQRGKQVTVFIEIKARFDEEANLAWGEKLEKAGVTVHYSFPGVKVHSKVAMVRRVEDGVGRLYTYMSTGNFHENTAKIYSDFGHFTSDPRITDEVARLFNYLETVKRPKQPFEHLLVGQFNMRATFISKIDREIKFAKAGKRAKIMLKMNSLQDGKMIEKLYEASQAGVEIRLIVRGIFSLVPEAKEFSENIRAISIVDRYLEHARVFTFHNGGKEELYLSSADWMTRNLSYRIETAFPIYDKVLRKRIIDLMEIQWADNVKSRTLDAKMKNTYRRTSQDLAIRSQVESYYYVKRLEDQAQVAWSENEYSIEKS
ncbi:MAG: polyphosphate kinase 1 [Saprospiraceae bacterium]